MTSTVTPLDEPGSPLSPGRRLGGFAIAVLGVVAPSVGLLPDRERVGVESVLLIFVLVSVIASAVGGVFPAATAAVLGFLAANLLFTPPYDTLYVQHAGQLVDLVLFVGIACGVGMIVESGSRVRRQAARARRLTSAMAELDNREYGEQDNVDRLLLDILDDLGMDRAELLADGVPVVVAGRPDAGEVAARLPAGDRLELRLYGPALNQVDADLLAAYGATAGRLWRSEQLVPGRAPDTAAVRPLDQRLVEAIGQLAEPVAGIRADVADLHARVARLTREEAPELADLGEELDRLEQLIAELLDLAPAAAQPRVAVGDPAADGGSSAVTPPD